jgi:MFS transporter, DHA1 family, multidrug resistance protein
MPKPDLPLTSSDETPRAPMALLVALMVTSQVAITIFLPSLPSMAGDLDTSQAMVQMTVSAYLGAFAIAQLVVGPISDAIGRRTPLIAGLVLFTLGSLACAAAPTIDILIAARMVQAIGGCACLVVGCAIVRDTTDGPAATRAMAYLGMSLAVAPMLAPLVGGQLETAFGWQSSFLFTALLGGLTLIATMLTLSETLPVSARRYTHVISLTRTYLRLCAMGKFMG